MMKEMYNNYKKDLKNKNNILLVISVIFILGLIFGSIYITILKNGEKTVSMWLLGLSVIGLPIIFIMIFFKSFTLGFSVSSIFAKYGFKGIVGVFTYIIPSPIILSIFSLFLASYSIIISVKILKGAFTKQTINFKTFMGKYFFILLVSILLSILCALFDAFVTPSFTKLFTNLIK